ncbi:hybrid sensor histidine kinase/response regulator transcription factor [Parasegetibacter sp. NRK P23]|uniref:hybrid sensor histidine kinase/response regulator transcription factor n=1 Tax=Parasegetibacter sp. NRK P23 TaxID=2942999 RepID=UPI0020449B87|nr:hybrid sensor histidine kinase/response regulator transcription factor [Parasegetibacter sp. NRK P23]MCM5528311.1 ATP-binding protein [Parasegetibacter sp. NRK P23]
MNKFTITLRFCSARALLRCLFALITLFSFQTSIGQLSEYNFVNFDNRDGLSSNSVNAILKDHTGYMWFGTDDGLNKFDGSKFVVYHHNTSDTNSISSNKISALCEDGDGNLWIGTSKSLSLYDRKRNLFLNTHITQGNAVRALYADQSGNIWVGCYMGLLRYNHKKGELQHFIADGKPGSLKSGIVSSILKDRKGRLWVGTNGGLHLYKPATGKFDVFMNSKDPRSISDNNMKAIVEDASGNIWIGTGGGGLNVFQPQDSTFKTYRSVEGNERTLLSDRVICLAVAPTGKLWVGSEKGLVIMDPETGLAQRIPHNPRNAFSLKGQSLRSLYIDKKGLYWVGSYQNGVAKYDTNLPFFHLVHGNPFDPYGLRAPNVTSFAEGKNGDIYVGADVGGLSVYHPKTGLFDQVKLSGKIVTVLALERAGDELWIGTYGNGIYVLNIQTGSIRNYHTKDGFSGLNCDEIFCLKKDRKGNIWVGPNGNEVMLFLPEKGVFQGFSNYLGGPTGTKPPARAYVRDIQEDEQGNIWLATHGRGVDVYNPNDRSLKLYNSLNTGFLLEEAFSILPGRNGKIWLGTYGNGLFVFDKRNGKLTNMNTNQQLSNAAINKILEDGSGKLWIGTNKGLSSLDPDRNIVRNYTFRNGLQRSSFNRGAGIIASTGELYFGGVEGFNHFFPDKLRHNANVPPVTFTGLKVDNQAVKPTTEKKSIINDHIGEAERIQVNYKQNLEIEFAALDFTNPDECDYWYYLKGFDKKWSRAGRTNSAVFTNLDPGEYEFQVKAVNTNEGWTTQTASVKLFVKPPFWRTNLAYVCYVLLAAALILGARRRGISKLKLKFAAEQEKQQIKQLIEAERREAERQRDFDQARIKFLTNLSHEFRTPISLISGPVQSLLEGETNAKKIGQLTMVKRNSRRLLNLVNHLLDFRRLEDKESHLNPEPGNIVDFVQEISESFRDLANRKGIGFLLTTAIESYYTQFDKDKMERILFNLLSNAFKFTPRGGTITVHVKQGERPGEEVFIEISDTGIGMSAEESSRIFDRFFQAETPPEIMNQGSGIGLSIVKEYVRMHEGNIQVQSMKGKGTSFTLIFPLKEVMVPEVAVARENTADSMEKTLEPAELVSDDAGERMTILLVEDDDDFRAYLRGHLEDEYRIIEAADGREGWQKALSGHPNVIISDISMPHMNGIDLSNKIKSDKRTAHIPVILLTALTGDTHQLMGLKTGASDYLSKPFSGEVLKLKIRNLVALNEQLKKTYSKRLKLDVPETAVQSENEKLLLKIRAYIEKNMYNENLSVEQLSKHLFMSRATLYNKILDMTGETPVEFIRSVKLQKAVELLEHSDMRIADIAYSVGFTSPNYFARAFKLKFNMSPTEYATQKRGTTG